MLADLADGTRDAVIVYNLDRLHRQPIELEEFVALCERAGVTNLATVTADFDLGNDDGLFMARMFAAVRGQGVRATSRRGSSASWTRTRPRLACRTGAQRAVRI